MIRTRVPNQSQGFSSFSVIRGHSSIDEHRVQDNKTSVSFSTPFQVLVTLFPGSLRLTPENLVTPVNVVVSWVETL